MPIGILAQIIKHLSTFVITTAPFSFFYITIIPVLWDASCRITYTTQITEREGSAGLKSIDVRSKKNLQLHLSSSVIDFSVFKLPGNYWCYVHLHPIWKKQPVLRKQADEGWRMTFSRERERMPSADKRWPGQKTPSLNFWKQPKETLMSSQVTGFAPALSVGHLKMSPFPTTSSHPVLLNTGF